MTEKITGLALLRQPIPEHLIGKMCRSTKKDNPKSKCSRCGGYHGQPSVQLSYVGHAAVTSILLDADPEWKWEPFAVGPDGNPVVDKDGGMWIRLTVCGVTRPGYGDNQSRSGGDGVKERIGDAIRNAAMRFGLALDQWHKGELVLPVKDDDGDKEDSKPGPEAWTTVCDDAAAAGKDMGEWWTKNATAIKSELGTANAAKVYKVAMAHKSAAAAPQEREPGEDG